MGTAIAAPGVLTGNHSSPNWEGQPQAPGFPQALFASTLVRSIHSALQPPLARNILGTTLQASHSWGVPRGGVHSMMLL